jgi:transposase
MQVKSLSRHFGVTQKTIYEWFDLWDKGSITSMPLKGGRGAKRSFEIFPRKKFLSLLKILHENQSLYWSGFQRIMVLKCQKRLFSDF